MASGYLEDSIDSLFSDSKEKEKLRKVLLKNGASAGFAKEVLNTIGHLRSYGNDYISQGKNENKFYLAESKLIKAGYSMDSAIEIIAKDSEKFCEVVAKTFKDMQPCAAHTPAYVYRALERYRTRAV